MTHLATLWDAAREAEAARDEGMLRVQAKSVDWRTVAYDVLVELARKRDHLTSDDLTDEMDRRGHVKPHDGRAVGPVIQKAIRAGVLVPDGFTVGRNPRHHADVCRTYRSGLR